jgi:endonuclease/exonuclease/phosphatase (EEP) superfamily protein YafD
MPDADPELVFSRDRAARRARLLTGLAWLVLGPLLLVAFLRLVAHDATLELIALNALSQWLYLPAWAVLVWALASRRWRLAVPAGCLALLHVVWIDPRGLVAAPLPAVPPSATRFRVMSANLLMINQDTEGIAGEVLAALPDLLLVQELSPYWAARLEREDLTRALPHRSFVARTDSFGIGVYSRLPMTAQELDVFGLPAFSAEVQLGAHSLRVLNVHTLPPRRPDYVPTWIGMMEHIEQLVRRETGPVLLGGDLNATPHTRWFQRLLSHGLQSAHEERGRTLATTWPNGRMPFPPIRLDHFLVSRAIAVLDVREGEGRGSDHRPLIGDFALLH